MTKFEAHGRCWLASPSAWSLSSAATLNHERAAEEARGLVRWLRPDFQNPAGRTETQKPLDLPPEETDDGTGDDETGDAAAGAKSKAAAKAKKEPWPKPLPERVRAVRAALGRHSGPASPDDIAGQFTRAQKAAVSELLETLVTVGQARRTDDGRYVP